MQRTPFEIKKGLRWCGGAAQIINGCSGGCPYYMGEDGCAEEDMHADALDYIQQLEARAKELELQRDSANGEAAEQERLVNRLRERIRLLDSTVERQQKENNLLEDAIDKLASSVPKWISVEERLPDTRDWVLVIGKFVPEGFWCVPNIAEYFHDSWHIKDAMCSSPEDLGIKVTHWMPLPEPPKEVET